MSKIKILLVDDVEFAIEMEKETLGRSDCKIITAMSGQEALESIKKEKPDIILMDLFMPSMNGDECCRIIKSDPEYGNIPIIMVTSANDDEAIERCEKSGCNGILKKPFQGVELYRKIKEFIDISVRQHIRVNYNSEIRYAFEGNSYLGEIFDLSESGLFIPSENSPPYGAQIKMEFSLPGLDEKISVNGEVVRKQKKSLHIGSDVVEGFGVRFIDLSEDHKMAIIDLAHSH